MRYLEPLAPLLSRVFVGDLCGGICLASGALPRSGVLRLIQGQWGFQLGRGGGGGGGGLGKGLN